MHSTACGVGASISACSSSPSLQQTADGAKMGLSNNDDAMNKIPLKPFTEDEEKNGAEFLNDTAAYEEARREKRRVKLLNLMKKLTIGILCFVGIALISYVIISLCFSEWPKSRSTNPHKNFNTTTRTMSSLIYTNTSKTATKPPPNNPHVPNSAGSPQSNPTPSKSSFLSDDNSTTSFTSANNTLTNSTLSASAVDKGHMDTNDVDTLNATESTFKTSATANASYTIRGSLDDTTELGGSTTRNISLLADIPILSNNFTSTLGVFQHAAVCSDKPVCSQIGSKILQDGGSAVDSAIASLLCVGITTPQSMGIGGGTLMNIFIKNNKQAYSVDAREVAPFAATEDMFRENGNLSLHGGLSIAVPGELMGYEKAHSKFGKLPWKKLVEPSLKICYEGFFMTKHMFSAYKSKFNRTKNDDILMKVFVNSSTQEVHTVGTKLFPLNELCKTYELLAANGAHDFYNGTLAKLISEDLKDLGSLITYDDLESYRADLVSSVTMQLGNDILYAVPPISSGTIVAYILSILEGLKITNPDQMDIEKRATVIHYVVEALKFGFAKRWELGDMRFNDVRELVSSLTNPETGIQLRKLIKDSSVLSSVHDYGAQFSGEDDIGTSPLVVMADNGDAVAVTSSINDYFGSGQVGKRTGIIFNSAMNDFSTPGQKNLFNLPPSPSNIVAPQKRPMSSMSPMILTDKEDNVRMAVSAAGGTKIISALVDVIVRVLWLDQNIKDAIDAPRFHSQLVPNVLEYEKSSYFSEELLKLLTNKGHIPKPSISAHAVVCGMVKNTTATYANADYRKQGGVAGY